MSRTESFVILDSDAQTAPANRTPIVESDNSQLLDAALALCHVSNPAPLPKYRTTKERTVSRRAVVWLGQTCNLHCEFCYFIDRVHQKSHPEHAFMPLEKAKQICFTLVDTYSNTSLDIEGGEPTLYPHILELISYCVEIGLHPTLITNAIVLDDLTRCRKMRDAGVRDFKISIHGLGEVHDRLVGRQGAHQRQMKAIRNMRELGIPFRFNTVLTPAAVHQLPAIARLAVGTGALCVNWLGYNPHEDQLEKTDRRNLIPNFTEMREPLTEALDILQTAGIETNVRYVPACMVEERHRECIYDYQQLFFDHREWDLASWGWTTLPPQRESSGPPSDPITVASLQWWVRLQGPLRWASSLPRIGKFMSIKRWVNDSSTLPLLFRLQRLMNAWLPIRPESRAQLYTKVARLHAQADCRLEYENDCLSCAARSICSGLLRDYHATFGYGENQPIEGPLIRDPAHYISRQTKIVELEDEVWAFSDGKRTNALNLH